MHCSDILGDMLALHCLTDRKYFSVCQIDSNIPVSVRECGYPEISKLNGGVKGRLNR